MDASFWFYTLSAIPQTLGAIIALTAAFMVFKLAKINDKIDSHIYHIKIILRGIKEKIPKEDKPGLFLKLFIGKEAIIDSKDIDWFVDKYASLFESYKIIVHDPSQMVSAEELMHWFNDQILDDLEKKYNNKKIIFSYLWKTLSIVSFAIMFCLFFLPFGSLLNDSLELLVISSSIGLGGGSIMATAITVFKIVKL